LKMVEDVALYRLLLLGFLDLVPDFGEPTSITATEVLPCHNALPIEGSECLV